MRSPDPSDLELLETFEDMPPERRDRYLFRELLRLNGGVARSVEIGTKALEVGTKALEKATQLEQGELVENQAYSLLRNWGARAVAALFVAIAVFQAISTVIIVKGG